MRLEDFRKIVLEPDPVVAREMSNQQRRQVSKLLTSGAARTDSSKAKKADLNSKENSSDRPLSNTSQLPVKTEIKNKSIRQNRIKSDAENRISPSKQKHSEEAVSQQSELVNDQPTKSFYSGYIQPVYQFYALVVAVYRISASLPSAILRRCKIELDATRLFNSSYLVVPALLYVAGFFKMTYPLFALCRLFLGTLYPAYASYKAVRTKNVREYVS